VNRSQAPNPVEKEALLAAPALGENALRRVRVVLVRPRGATNVGSAARAMKNMGLHDLALVEPKLRRLNRGGVMAVHARDLLEKARIVDDLSAALSDCTLIVGTTRRGGLYRAAAVSLEMLAPLIVDHARRGRVALVFGPEDHGLTNDDLKHCQRLIQIDTSPDYPSLNLAQAVLLCCYELRRAAQAGAPAKNALEPAPAADVEFLFERLQSAFLRIGFLNPQNPDHIMFALRRVLGRAQLEASDIRIFLGLARQIEWYGSGGFRHAAEDPGQ
jgi:tRNA/rRNA methyltransferase